MEDEILKCFFCDHELTLRQPASNRLTIYYWCQHHCGKYELTEDAEIILEKLKKDPNYKYVFTKLKTLIKNLQNKKGIPKITKLLLQRTFPEIDIGNT